MPDLMEAGEQVTDSNRLVLRRLTDLGVMMGSCAYRADCISSCNILRRRPGRRRHGGSDNLYEQHVSHNCAFLSGSFATLSSSVVNGTRAVPLCALLPRSRLSCEDAS